MSRFVRLDFIAGPACIQAFSAWNNDALGLKSNGTKHTSISMDPFGIFENSDGLH